MCVVGVAAVAGSDWAHRDNDGRTPLEHLQLVEQQQQQQQHVGTARYATAVSTLSEFETAVRAGKGLHTVAGAQALCVDLIRRLETQRIVNMLMDMMHQSERLLTQTRLEEQHLTHLEQLQQYDLDNERLRAEVLDCQGKIKRLKETATGRTISALATELAVARARLPGTSR